MNEIVYHFTDTLTLPWIIESGALRPHAKLLVGIGRPFLRQRIRPATRPRERWWWPPGMNRKRR